MTFTPPTDDVEPGSRWVFDEGDIPLAVGKLPNNPEYPYYAVVLTTYWARVIYLDADGNSGVRRLQDNPTFQKEASATLNDLVKITEGIAGLLYEQLEIMRNDEPRDRNGPPLLKGR